MSAPRLLPGKFVWFELVTSDLKTAQSFYGEVLGWKVRAFPVLGSTYDMVYLGETMLGGYAPTKQGERSRWDSYVSVDDVDSSARTAAAAGGKVLVAPFDAPGVGRLARIADPQGAELFLFKKDSDDPVDTAVAPLGGWLWNELHTTDPAGAVSFYEKVVGYTGRAMDMGPAGTYHIVSRSGQDRGGITGHLQPGFPPHWLPYVSVDDADATLARVEKNGGKTLMGAHDIPGIGRFGIIADPTGGVLAVMKSAPMQP